MTKIIAHRGASARTRENTVESFALAVELGADGIELDVRRTADGQPAVHHDAHLADGRLICELEVAELPDYVPLLPQALSACGEVMVNIEIKNLSIDNVAIDPDFDPAQTMAAAVVEVVQARGIAERVVVSSFGFEAIERVGALALDLRTAWLVVPQSLGGVAEAAALVAKVAGSGHHGIHPIWTMADAELVTRAHDAGLFVNVWTVDDPDEIRRLAELEVDGIVTNVPDVALAALGRG